MANVAVETVIDIEMQTQGVPPYFKPKSPTNTKCSPSPLQYYSASSFIRLAIERLLFSKLDFETCFIYQN